MAISPKEEIRDRLNIVDVINGYVRLRKAGSSYKANCPFHSEKTPSFSVSPDKQMWYCFGCAEGGDIFTFIEKIENVEFPDALRVLADRAGIELKKEDPRVRSERKEIYEVLALAAKFFVRQLDSKTGKAVEVYLKDRGLEDKTIKNWQLGYAPDSWDSLYDFLMIKGFSAKIIEMAGLALKSQRGRAPYHDRFRHRIIFPIHDIQGQVTGFAGRVFDKIIGNTVGKDAGKYINSPNNLIYDKSRVLYGLSKAREAIKEKESCILVEGNLDVILAHQAGSGNTVAVSGTALAAGHLRILKRYTEKISLAFDPDDAGERATHRGAVIALAQGFSVSVIELDEGHDVADAVLANKKDWIKKTNQTVPFVSYAIQKAINKSSLQSVEGKKTITGDILGIIKVIPSPVEQDHWMGELSLKTGIEERVLLAEQKNIKTFASEDNFQSPSKKETSTPQKRDKLEGYLLALLAGYPEGITILKKENNFFKDDFFKEAFIKISTAANAEKVLKNDRELSLLLMRSEFLNDLIEDEGQEFMATLAEIKKRRTKDKLRAIEVDIKRAESIEDLKATNNLAMQFNKLSQELISYEKEKAQKD